MLFVLVFFKILFEILFGQNIVRIFLKQLLWKDSVLFVSFLTTPAFSAIQ